MKINRIWAMPNKNTFEIKPIKEMIDKYRFGVSVDPSMTQLSPLREKHNKT